MDVVSVDMQPYMDAVVVICNAILNVTDLYLVMGNRVPTQGDGAKHSSLCTF